jgi:hypothetical protein
VASDIEFEITATVKAKPGDFASVTECMTALSQRAEEIVKPYGGRLFNVVMKDYGDGDAKKDDKVVIVMKASGVLQS